MGSGLFLPLCFHANGSCLSSATVPLPLFGTVINGALRYHRNANTFFDSVNRVCFSYRNRPIPILYTLNGI